MQHRRGMTVSAASRIAAAALLFLTAASAPAAAQQLAQKPAAPSPAAASSSAAKSPAPVIFKITKVEFLPSYQMLRATARAKPYEVIVVVQTDWEPHGSVTSKLDHYAIRYTTAGSNTGSVPALASGTRHTLVNGEQLQIWNCAQAGVVSGVSAQNITGFTVVAALPQDVTSFTVSNQEISFASPPIQRSAWPVPPATK